MIKAHLPPEKSVYSLPRAVPGTPKPPRPHTPVRRPAAIPVPAPETTPGNHPPKLPPGTSPASARNHSGNILEIPRPKPSCTHPREPALKPSLQPPTLETIPGTISETTAPGTDLQTPDPPRPLRKPGHFPRSKAIRPGQGILPGTNIDRE